MKVLQINAVNGIRSTGRIVSELSTYINTTDNECYVAYSHGIPDKNGYKIGNIIGEKLHALFSRIFGLQGYYSKHSTGNLIKYIKIINPDIIHLHNLHSNFINLKILFHYIATNDIATVITLHDCWFYTGKCCHYTINQCFKWKTGCYKCSNLNGNNTSWFFDRTKKLYIDKKNWFNSIPRLAVIGVSDWIINDSKQSLLSSAKIIRRIYNWIDIEIFKPVNTREMRYKLDLVDKFVILGVASDWSNKKGLDKFIDFSRLIPKSMRIMLIGNINSNVKLPKNIIHIKGTNNIIELVEYYSLADVFLNLSLEETFGMVSAESLACGTPVIAIDSTANAELIGEKCGIIIKEYNINTIFEYINDIRKKGKKYYSEYCIEYAKNKFNKEERLKDYLISYEQLLIEKNL